MAVEKVVQKFALRDSVSGEIAVGRIEIGWQGIELYFKDYGHKTMDEGPIVFVELWANELRVVLSPDINVEDPMIINMEGAHESNREDEDE